MSAIIVKGKVRVWKNGVLVYEDANRITQSGLNLIANVFSSTATSRVKAMACATSIAPTTATQTKLSGTEKGRAVTGVVRSNAQLTYTATFAGVSGTVREIGLFNATTATTGSMLARFLTAAIILATGDELKASWQITFGTATG